MGPVIDEINLQFDKDTKKNSTSLNFLKTIKINVIETISYQLTALGLALCA